MKNSTAKLVSIGGMTIAGVITGQIMALPVVIVASGIILCIKEKTPHQRLVSQCKSSMKMNYYDAENYAKNLEKICTQEYKRAFAERTIDKED